MITLPVRVEKPRSSPSVHLHFQLLLHLGTLGELSQRAEQDLDRVWPVVIPLELYKLEEFFKWLLRESSNPGMTKSGRIWTL